MEAAWKAQIKEFLVDEPPADEPREPKFERIEEVEEEQLFSSNDHSGPNTDRQLKRELGPPAVQPPPAAEPRRPSREAGLPRSAPLSTARNKSTSSDHSLKAVARHRFFNQSIIEAESQSRESSKKVLKQQKNSAEAPGKPLGIELRPRTVRSPPGSAVQRLLRKRSQEALGESGERLGGEAGWKERGSEAGPGAVGRTAKFVRQCPLRKRGYSYQLPQHLFQSLITNKRLHAASETKAD